MNSKLRPNTHEQNVKLNLSRAVTTSAQFPSPKGCEYLPFQRAGIEYALLNRNTLNGDPPGVGKTIQAIGFLNAKEFDRVLVLCPASLVFNWAREMRKWHIGSPVIEIFHPKYFNPNHRHDVVICSYYWAAQVDAVKLLLSWGSYQTLILDEAQALKTADARRTKYTLSKNGLISKAEHVQALSGTPLTKHPMDLWPLITTLCPDALGGMSQFEFGIQFCGGFKAEYGWDFSGASNMPLLGQILRSNFMLRRKKEEVLPSLPSRFPPNLVYIDTSPSAKQLIRKMSLFDENVLDVRAKTVEFTEASEMRRELGILKVPASVNYIETQLKSGHEKIVVFAHHKEVIEGLKQDLCGYGVGTITGSDSSKARDKTVHRFQNDPEMRLIIVSITAGGVGLTLTAASYNIFVEWPWIYAEIEQAIDRLHRIGQTRGVMTDFLVQEGSLDERILKKNWKRKVSFEELMQ